MRQEICSYFKQNFLHSVIPSVEWQISVPTFVPTLNRGTPGTRPQMKDPVSGPIHSILQNYTQEDTQVLGGLRKLTELPSSFRKGDEWGSHALDRTGHRSDWNCITYFYSYPIVIIQKSMCTRVAFIRKDYEPHSLPLSLSLQLWTLVSAQPASLTCVAMLASLKIRSSWS